MVNKTNGPNVFGIWQGSRDDADELNDMPFVKMMDQTPKNSLEPLDIESPLPFCLYNLDPYYICELWSSDKAVVHPSVTTLYCGPVYITGTADNPIMFFSPVIPYHKNHKSLAFTRLHPAIVRCESEETDERYAIDARRALPIKLSQIDLIDISTEKKALYNFLKSRYDTLRQYADYIINPANKNKRFDDLNTWVKSDSMSDIPFGIYNVDPDYLRDVREDGFGTYEPEVTTLYCGPVYTSDYPNPKTACFVPLMPAYEDEQPKIKYADMDAFMRQMEETPIEYDEIEPDDDHYYNPYLIPEPIKTEHRFSESVMGFDEEFLQLDDKMYNIHFNKFIICSEEYLTPVQLSDSAVTELKEKENVLKFCADFCWNPNRYKQLNGYVSDGYDYSYQEDLHKTFIMPDFGKLIHASFFQDPSITDRPSVKFTESKNLSTMLLLPYDVNPDYLKLLYSVDHRVMNPEQSCRYYGPIYDVTTEYGDVSFYIPLPDPNVVEYFSGSQGTGTTYKAVPIPDNMLTPYESDSEDYRLFRAGEPNELYRYHGFVATELGLKQKVGEIKPTW